MDRVAGLFPRSGVAFGAVGIDISLIEICDPHHIGAEETSDLFNVARHFGGIGDGYPIRIYSPFWHIFHNVVQTVPVFITTATVDTPERILAESGLAPGTKPLS